MTHLVAPNDGGIRPAGPPDACFYCQRKVGEHHRFTCVTATSPVLVECTVRLQVDAPISFSPADIEFRYGQSSWCADNLVGLLQEQTSYCLCDNLIESKFIRRLPTAMNTQDWAHRELEAHNDLLKNRFLLNSPIQRDTFETLTWEVKTTGAIREFLGKLLEYRGEPVQDYLLRMMEYAVGEGDETRFAAASLLRNSAVENDVN